MNITKRYNLCKFFEPPKLSLPSLRVAFILHQQRSHLFNSLSQEGFNTPLREHPCLQAAKQRFIICGSGTMDLGMTSEHELTITNEARTTLPW